MLGDGIFNPKVVALIILKIHKLFEEAQRQKMIIKQQKESLKNILNQEIEGLRLKNYSKFLSLHIGRVSE